MESIVKNCVCGCVEPKSMSAHIKTKKHLSNMTKLNETKLMESNLWSVVFTSYEDDYKHRYDSGVYPEAPVIFKSLSDAEIYVAKRLEHSIIQRIYDQEMYDEIKDGLEE